MNAAKIKRIKADISTLLSTNAGVAPSRVTTLLPIKGLQGKLYEAHVLATVCEKLHTEEKYTLTLKNGTNLMLKQKGGPINRNYPFFEVRKSGVLVYELWTDVYFTTLSYQLKGRPKGPIYGDYHELDIALLSPRCKNIPSYDMVKIAIECKNTSIKKSIIREMLGFRRELSFFSPGQQHTGFNVWPAKHLHADIGDGSDICSVHMLYCSDKRVLRYKKNCFMFGILIEYHVL